MSTIITSANMSLPVPVVGQDLGPQYAIDVNSCMALIDSHDHSVGNGVKISQAGINITGDLPFNGFNATLLRSTRFSPQASALALGPDLACAYVVNDDLYFNDGLGNQIRMTASGGIAGTPGSIAGLVAPASATYIPASSKFVWQSAINTSADMDMGSITIRENAASANGITINSPTSLASSYAINLFTGLPASKKQVFIDSSGNLTAEANASFNDAQNYTLTATVAANALTISLKTLAGSDPSASDFVSLGFRSATLSSGSFSERTVAAATSIVIPSGTTIGTVSGVTSTIYVYAMDNGGTVVLACSLTLFDDKVVQSSSNIAAGSSSSTLYSTSAQSSLPIRLLGQLSVTEAAAGVWVTVPYSITLSNKVIGTPDVLDRSITYEKLASATFESSSSCGSFTTSSTSLVDVTNLSLTITTNGRPVYLALVPDGSASPSFTGVGGTSTGATTITMSSRFAILRGSTVIAESAALFTFTPPGAQAISSFTPAGITYVDLPAAGFYTYKVQASLPTATSITSGAVYVSQWKLIAIEL